MAHMMHFKSSDVKRLCTEYEREKGFNNSDGRIDETKTKLNYSMRPRRIHHQLSYDLPKRVAQVPHAERKDLNVMSTWIVTLPDQLKLASDEEKRRFFEITYKFTEQRYGEQNVMNGYVHMDETTPHIHMPLVPVAANGRISAKSLFTRKELSSYQRDLEAVMVKEFGVDGLILNGRTKGNLTVEELKERTRQENDFKQTFDKLEAFKSELTGIKHVLDDREASLQAQEGALRQKVEDFTVERENWLKTTSERSAQLDAREADLLTRERSLKARENLSAYTHEVSSSDKQKVSEIVGTRRISPSRHAEMPDLS